MLMRVIRMMRFIFIIVDQEKHPEWRVANVGASRSCRACWPTAASLVAVKRARDPKNSWRPRDSWIYTLEIVKIQWKLFEALVICGFLERSMTNSKQEVALLQTIPDHPRPSQTIHTNADWILLLCHRFLTLFRSAMAASLASSGDDVEVPCSVEETMRCWNLMKCWSVTE